MCTKAELAELLRKAPGNAQETYKNIYDYLIGQGCVAMATEVSTCSLQSNLAAFPAVETFGKPAKAPHTGLRMPPVHEQLQIAANHFANACLVLWAEVSSDENTEHSAQSKSKLVWGTYLLTKQVCKTCSVCFSGESSARYLPWHTAAYCCNWLQCRCF